MTRRLKALGLCLGALLAIGALGASGAAAQFESEAEETALTVSSNEAQEFQIAPGGTTIKCTSLHIDEGVTFGWPQIISIEFKKTWTNCHPTLGLATTVQTNNCSFVDHLAAGSTTGTTDVECEGTKGIEIKIGNICTYKISTQTGLGSVTYKNVGEGTTREIKVVPNVTGITSTRTTNDFFCPAASNEGTYTGNSTITGEDAEGNHIGIWVD